MKLIETEIIITSKPDKVRAILTDFNAYPNWNPFINSISREKKVGEKLKVFVQPPEGSGMTYKPVVLTFNETSR